MLPAWQVQLGDGQHPAHKMLPFNLSLLQCVNLGTYEANKVVTFIPPDGEFELMRYSGRGAGGLHVFRCRGGTSTGTRVRIAVLLLQAAFVDYYVLSVDYSVRL